MSDLADVKCVLLDMHMPGRNGIEVLRELGERESFPPVVVLTGHGDVALAVDAMKLGAMDFIEKPYEPTILLDSIAVAISNRQSRKVSVAPSKEALALIANLSARQREVLVGMLDGDTNKVMAWKLGISIRTVEAHRTQVMARLRTGSIAKALQIGIAAGVVSSGGV